MRLVQIIGALGLGAVAGACAAQPAGGLRHGGPAEGCYLSGVSGEVIATAGGGVAIRAEGQNLPNELVDLAWPGGVTSRVGPDGQVSVLDETGALLLVSGREAYVPGGFENDYFAACPSGIVQE